MNTVITPELLRSIVGDLDIECDSMSDSSAAVAVVDITHECIKSYKRNVNMCDGHLAKVQSGILICKFCKNNLPCVGIVWL